MKKIILSIIVITLLSIPAVLPLFGSGFFRVHDDTQITRVYEMGTALSDGVFPVRWVENLGYGYGYPIFNFYSPLPYYIGGIFSLAGFNVLIATKIMFFAGVILSGITMFFLARRFYGNVAGITAGIIYMYFPYHAVNIYIRGAVGEFFAYSFLPLVILGIFELTRKSKITLRNSISWIVVSSIGLALVIISHNLSALMLLILLVLLYPLMLVVSKNRSRLTACIFSIVLLGGIISAFYSVPAILEMKYTNVASQIGGGADFKDHFVCISQLWDSAWGFGGSTSGCLDGISFKLGKINIILALSAIVIAVYMLFKKRNKDLSLVGFSIVLIFTAIFLTLDGSFFIWERVEFMKYIQFPWRFLNFSGLFISFIIGFLTYETLKIGKVRGYLVVLAILGGTLAFNAKLFSPVTFISDVTAYTNHDSITWEISKISDEYMPSKFEKPMSRVEIPTEIVEILEGDGSLEVVSKKTGYMLLNFENRTAVKIKVNKAYFPAFKVWANSHQIDMKEGKKGMEMDLPEGMGVLEIRFEQTYIEKISNLASVIGIALVIVGIIYIKRKANHES